jgi:hypothetical protein
MIFKKYELKVINQLLKKNNKISAKFFQKPIRNVNVILNEFLISTNNSILENKIKFNFIKLNSGRLVKLTQLNKKKII